VRHRSHVVVRARHEPHPANERHSAVFILVIVFLSFSVLTPPRC
jgi:hypothetical protein